MKTEFHHKAMQKKFKMHHLRETFSGGQIIAENVDHFQGPIIGLFSPLRMSNGRPRALHPGKEFSCHIHESIKKQMCPYQPEYLVIFFDTSPLSNFVIFFPPHVQYFLIRPLKAVQTLLGETFLEKRALSC